MPNNDGTMPLAMLGRYLPLAWPWVSEPWSWLSGLLRMEHGRVQPFSPWKNRNLKQNRTTRKNLARGSAEVKRSNHSTMEAVIVWPLNGRFSMAFMAVPILLL